MALTNSNNSQTLQTGNNFAPHNTYASLSVDALALISQELPKLSRYIESSALDITEQFKKLAESSSKQSTQLEDIVSLSRTVELEGKQISFEESISILYEPLSDAIEKILQVSRLAMSMVMTISNAADNIKRVESFIDEVQQITKQTNMLAMNTQIEAARAGEAGKSFQIIAQEVKSLSTHIKGLSEDMQREISEVATSIRQSTDITDELANYDMTSNIELKERIDRLIENIISQNNRYNALLNETATSARVTASTIDNTIIGIQFQDKSTQVIGDLLSLLGEVIRKLKSGDSSGPVEAEIEILLSTIKLSEMRRNLVQLCLDTNIITNSSYLVAKYLSAMDDNAGGDRPSRISEHDIELF